MNIVVTGGAGFIGSHVAEKLSNSGYNVRVIDDLSFGYKKFVDKRAEFFEGSIGNRQLLKKALDRADMVMHLAASSIISFSYKYPRKYFENNVLNGIILLEVMREKKVNKIIYSSTAAVYGEPQKVPIKEADPKNPKTVYGASKLAFEDALQAYYYSFGIESVSLRYYNAYGPRDEQKPATRAIPMWIKAIIQRKPIPWYWKGEQIRDYVYVKDIAQAHIDAMNLPGFNIFNIGSGKGIAMNEVLRILGKIAGKKLETVNMGNRAGDPKMLIADISKIKKAVGWFPKISLEDGLRKTYEYYTKKDKN